jgi:hypothetical protein
MSIGGLFEFIARFVNDRWFDAPPFSRYIFSPYTTVGFRLEIIKGSNHASQRNSQGSGCHY